MKSYVSRILFCAALTCALSACTAGKNAPSQGGKEIGVELPLLTSPFWQSYDSYLSHYAAQYRLRVLPPSNANGDTAKFLNDAQNMIAEGVDGLVLSPTDTAAVVTSLNKAQAANIPVVTVDVAPDSGKVFMVVRADNKAYGRLACTYIGDHVKSGEVVQIEGDLASVNGRDRTQAFNDCMAKNYPAITVLQIAARWDGERAASGLEALYAAHPHIKAIYMQAGGVYLAPTLAVLRRHAGLVPAGTPGHIVIVSNDGIPQELDAIRKGEIDATVSQPADLYAQYGLYYIDAALRHKTFKPGPTKHGSLIVRLANGMLEDQLPAPLITKTNVDGKQFWGNTLSQQ